MCDCKGEPERHAFVLADDSLQASPDVWATTVIDLYHDLEADRVVGETNYGGDMVEHTIRGAAKNLVAQELDEAEKAGTFGTVSYKNVHASRGKADQTEPVAAAYEQGRVHHVGTFPLLEDELTSWEPGDNAPIRLDSLVWAVPPLPEQTQTSLEQTMPLAPQSWPSHPGPAQLTLQE